MILLKLNVLYRCARGFYRTFVEFLKVLPATQGGDVINLMTTLRVELPETKATVVYINQSPIEVTHVTPSQK